MFFSTSLEVTLESHEGHIEYTKIRRYFRSIGVNLLSNWSPQMLLRTWSPQATCFVVYYFRLSVCWFSGLSAEWLLDQILSTAEACHCLISSKSHPVSEGLETILSKVQQVERIRTLTLTLSIWIHIYIK